MRIWGVNFQSPGALNKVATTASNKDKAVRVHKGRGLPVGVAYSVMKLGGGISQVLSLIVLLNCHQSAQMGYMLFLPYGQGS